MTLTLTPNELSIMRAFHQSDYNIIYESTGYDPDRADTLISLGSRIQFIERIVTELREGNHA
jgi:hypothetical protein